MRPDETAVVDGDVRWTWRVFTDRVARFAGALRQLGVVRGDRVAMLSLNSRHYLEFYMGTLWAGAAIMPLNHRLGPDELGQLVEDGEPKILIVSPEFAAIGRAVAEASGCLQHLLLAGTEPENRTDLLSLETDLLSLEKVLIESEPAEEAELSSEDLACLFYTGGTTGRPKGVMLTHGNIMFNSLNLIPEVQMDEHVVHLHAGPLFHVAAGVRIYSVSLVGGTHVVLPRFALPQVLETIEREGVTLATLVPTMLRRIVQDPDMAGYRCPSLQCITYGAAPMPPSLVEMAMRRFPHVRFVQSYGMTETSPIVSILGARDHGDDRLLASAGRAALTAEVRIMTEDGSEAGPGQVGEIAVRGPMVMKGYWRNPSATAETIRDGWLHTGDLGYLDERGYVFVVDRLKDVIISGGENIYSSEIETVLSAHPGVAECAVIGLHDETWGERVHAVVVARAGARLSPDELERHCRVRLAGYKVPRSFEFRGDPLPVSNVNKVLKDVLREQAVRNLEQTGNE